MYIKLYINILVKIRFLIIYNINLFKFFNRQGGTRTPDTVVRSHILYPTELLVRIESIAKLI